MENQDKIFDKIKSAAQNAENNEFSSFDKVWSRVEEKLDKKEDKKVIVLWKKIAVAASLLLFFSLGYQFLKNDPKIVSPNVKSTNDVVITVEKKSDSVTSIPKEDNAIATQEKSPLIKKDADVILENQIKNQQTVAFADDAKKESSTSKKDAVYKEKAAIQSDEVAVEDQAMQNSSRNSVSESNAVVASAPKNRYEEAKMTSVYDEKLKTIIGVVSDDSGPLPGANVVVKGTNRGIQTDFDGKFSIKADKGEQLAISYIGFNEQVATIGDAKTMNFKLNSDNVALDEVVVTAFGIKKTPRELAYASQNVKSKELVQDDIKTAVKGFNGKVSGIKITNEKIEHDTQMDSKYDPIVVINESILNKKILDKINPNSIESVNILKDSVSTKLYGERGKNGVIILKLKKLTKIERKKINQLIEENTIK